MAALDFPASPSSGQRYSANGSTWEWNGSAWIKLATTSGPTDQVTTTNDTSTAALYPVMVDGAGDNKPLKVSTSKLKFDASAGGLTVTGTSGEVTAGVGNTALIVDGDARVLGILTVGSGTVKIDSAGVTATGVATFTNFKTGTTNVHNVGVEAAGINVLGADTPIGTGATVYNSGLIVSKSGGEYQGVVTASTFKGAVEGDVTGNINGTTGTFSGDVSIGGVLTYEDVKNVDAIGIITARAAVSIADSIVHTGDTDTSIRFPAADTITAETSGSERLRIKSNGYVGINETNPSYQVDVKGDSGITQSASSNSTAGQISIMGRNSSGASSAISRLKSYPDGSSSQSHFAIETRNSSASMVERLRITSDGKVGINTSTPYAYDTTATTFEVKGSVSSAADTEVARFRGGSDADGGTAVLRLTNNNDRGLVVKGGRESTASEYAEFGVSAFNGSYTRVLKLTAAGRIGIGTATPTYGSHLHGTGASNNAYYMAEQSSAGASAGFRLKTTGSHFSIYGATSGSALGIYDYNASAERFTIDGNGRILIGTSAGSSFNANGDNLIIRSSGTTGLTLSGGGTDDCNIFFSNAEDNHVSAQINYDNDANLLRLIAGESNGVITFCTVSSTERLRIDHDGNVYFAGSQSGNNRGILYNHATGFGIYASADSNTNRDIRFYSNSSSGSQRLCITATGQLQQDGTGGISYFKGSSEYIFGSNLSSPASGGAEAKVQIHDYKTRAAFSINAYMNNAGGPFMQFISSRSGTLGTLGTKCQNNDYLGEFRFMGDNGTNSTTLCQGAGIYALAASTPADGDTTIAGEIYFTTGTASGGSQPVRACIDSAGRLTLNESNIAANAKALRIKADNDTTSNASTDRTGSNSYKNSAIVIQKGISNGNLVAGLIDAWDGSIHATSIGIIYDGSRYHTSIGVNNDTNDRPVEIMRISGNKTVKIGGGPASIAATVGLEIGGDGTTTEIRLKNSGGGTGSGDGFAIQKWNNGNNYIYDYDSNNILFGTSNGSRTRMDSAGRWTFAPSAGSALTSGSTTIAMSIVNNGGSAVSGSAYPGIAFKSLATGGGNGMSIVNFDGNWDLYTRSGNQQGLAILHSNLSSSGNARLVVGDDGKCCLGTEVYDKLSTSRDSYTALHVAGGALSIGPKGNNTATREGGRYVLGWYMMSAYTGHSYIHVVTDLWGGGSSGGGNNDYIMGGFHIHGHAYSGGNGQSEERIYFHNWSGGLYGYSRGHWGAWNPGNAAYVNSNGYVTIRLLAGSYRGYIIDLVQHAWYPVRNIQVTAHTGSDSSTI